MRLLVIAAGAVIVGVVVVWQVRVGGPTTAQNPPGGGANIVPATPEPMVEYPIAFASGFDDMTAIGTDLVGSMQVQITGQTLCVSPQSSALHGRFLVTIGDQALAPTPAY